MRTMFSADRRYRYTLHRRLHAPDQTIIHRTVTFIGLNPSTADEELDDPTIRRCIGYATSWGGSELYMLNLFALRSTDPKLLYSEAKPVGRDNDHYIEHVARTYSDIIVAAWGTHGALGGRGIAVMELLEGLEVFCLGVTKAGHPKHPLYLRSDTALTPYRGLA